MTSNAFNAMCFGRLSLGSVPITTLVLINMGIVTCIALKCGNRRIPGSFIRFHQFPGQNEQKRKRQWEIATKIDGYSARKGDVLCGNHFTSDSYILGGQSKKLKPDAVPSIFEFPLSSSHHSSTATTPVAP